MKVRALKHQDYPYDSADDVTAHTLALLRKILLVSSVRLPGLSWQFFIRQRIIQKSEIIFLEAVWRICVSSRR